MLAISAGGDHSSWVLGMLRGVFSERPDITDWKITCGISAGALISSQIAEIEVGDRSGFIRKVNQLCNSHVDFVKSWSSFSNILGIVKGMIWHASLFDGQLKNIINNNWAPKCRDLYVGTYNQTKGQYESFGPNPDIDLVAASASIPVVFQPVWCNDMKYCDGGLAHIIPINEIKEHWKEGDLDVMICYPTDRSEYLKTCEVLSRFKLVGRVMDTISESNWFNLKRDIDALSSLVGQDVSKGGTFKVGDRTVRVYVPDKGIYCDVVNRNFNTLRRMQAHGEKIAKKILST
jgi:predicted acylesterase/phospholipase RssA